MRAMKKYIVPLLLLNMFSSISAANVIGTEYQNFNPSLSGTDFTTVHSSEPVKACRYNLGVFFNYAKNTLTYSDKYHQTNLDLRGVRADDYLIGADVYGAYGINDNWDIGVALPFIVNARNNDPYGVSYFNEFGLTEVRPMTKIRFYGDDDHGLAVIGSANFNLIKNNPFAGSGGGPTFNIELAADTTVLSDVKMAANVGYKKRNPGSQLFDNTTGLLVPFVPFTDSFIYSLAIARNFQSLNSDLLAELKGSQPGGNGSDSIKTAQRALEVDLGLRNHWSKDTIIHVGAGTKLNDAQSTPDVRFYAGLTYQMGSECKDSSQEKEAPAAMPTAVINNHPTGVSEVTKLNMSVSALNPDDYSAYKWKMGPTVKINCYNQINYSAETAGELPIIQNIETIPDGGVTLCAVAKNKSDEWQSFESPTIVNWTKSKSPVAVIQNHPTNTSDKIDLTMPVTSTNPLEFAAYRWKIGETIETNCKKETGYSNEISGNLPIVTGIGPIPDGAITLCAVAKNNAGLWQPFSAPTIINWNKKKGYQLFRLGVSVLFDFDEDILQKRSYGELDKINTHLKKKPYTQLIIEGHTDNIGTDSYNVDLSKRRASRVMSFMIKTYNLQSHNVKVDYKGEANPVDTNDTKEGRDNNRRVEFKIFR